MVPSVAFAAAALLERRTSKRQPSSQPIERARGGGSREAPRESIYCHSARARLEHDGLGTPAPPVSPLSDSGSRLMCSKTSSPPGRPDECVENVIRRRLGRRTRRIVRTQRARRYHRTAGCACVSQPRRRAAAMSVGQLRRCAGVVRERSGVGTRALVAIRDKTDESGKCRRIRL